MTPASCVPIHAVFLTRGRNAHAVFVPAIGYLDETWNFPCESGSMPLSKTRAGGMPDLNYRSIFRVAA